MKNATVRQVRHDFGSVIAMVEEGESVAVSKRGRVIAVISPPPVEKKRARKRPDFARRLKRMYGETVFPGNIIVEDRKSLER